MAEAGAANNSIQGQPDFGPTGSTVPGSDNMSFAGTRPRFESASSFELSDFTNSAEARCPKSWWLDALCILLSGYALFGKGCAYLGIPPLYVGELVLILGFYFFWWRGNWRYVIGSPMVWPLIVLAGWTTLTTLPHLRSYGLDALRDAMICGYAAFALIVMGVLVSEPTRMQLLLERYERLIPIFLVVVPFVYIGSQLDMIPNWPWANAAMVDMKGGDALVHLGGILSFWALGLGRRVGKGWIVLLLGLAVVIGAANRGGLVAFLMAYGICLVFRPYSRLLWSIIAIGICSLIFLAISEVKFELPGKHREFSAEQILENVWSVIDQTPDTDLDATKQWRINWWTDIVNYTWNGKHFWTGKGFGINLADSDGYQGTDWSGQLRSPHNGHLTLLARAGVPGLAFWLFPQLLWFWFIVKCCLRSLAYGQMRWNSFFVFLLAYWTALITRASFDVYLEGPVGGIWFWTIYGVGLSAIVIYSYCPECFAEQGSEHENSACS
jgi:hypothetical protein